MSVFRDLHASWWEGRWPGGSPNQEKVDQGRRVRGNRLAWRHYISSPHFLAPLVPLIDQGTPIGMYHKNATIELHIILSLAARPSNELSSCLPHPWVGTVCGSECLVFRQPRRLLAFHFDEIVSLAVITCI